MQKYRKEEWIFLNCNSPADLAAEYIENGVCLCEYDRCRNGHMLVSNFLVKNDDVDFTTVIESMEDAAGIGLYYGMGGYDNYLMAVVLENSISLRISNGVPLGDTFRYEGAKRYFEIMAEKEKAEFPLEIRFQKRNQEIKIWYKDKKVLECTVPYSTQIKNRNPRIMLKAENSDKESKTCAVFSGYELRKRVREEKCTGCCVWEDGEVAAEVSLHIPAFRNQWTVTEKQGNFQLEKLPYGKYICVAGEEKTGFSSFELIHDGGEHQYIIPKNKREKRENKAQGALISDREKIELNGIWKFDWDKAQQGEEEKWFCPDKHIYSRRIEVPFSWQSLQAFGEGFLADAYSLHQNCSWVTNAEEMGKTAWYQRTIYVNGNKKWNLMLGAVAGSVKVWLNDNKIKREMEAEAEGNFYNPLRFPLGILEKEQSYLLTIKVTYPFHSNNCCNGKQGFWFTDAPGIWQNVWLEEERKAEIEDIIIDYILDVKEKTADVSGKIIFSPHCMDACYAEIEIGNQTLKVFPKKDEEENREIPFFLTMKELFLWSPEEPYLYTLQVTLWKDNRQVGRSSRKVGFRTIETKENQIFLNNRPIYIRGVLDQGYNPWGIYTYPFIYGNRPGSMEYDIRKAKEFGYNLIRMHIKDNEPEWYSLCDELGMLVWDEHPSNFYGTWDDALWRERYRYQLMAMAKKHNYHPSVVMFSVFNESWGITGGHEMSPWEEQEAQRWQKESAVFYKEKNNQALVIDNSGYAKTCETQILDYHMYPDCFSGARDFFGRMTAQNYNGSNFNCYNKKNHKLMKNFQARELLQRNCSMDLGMLSYAGDEEQKGQPVIISEFVHTNQIDQLVRIMPGISGYIRMNLSSQENEDTSALTSTRVNRDFGFIHEDFSEADYSIINSRNLIMADYPPLTRKQNGDEVVIPIFVSLWEEIFQEKELKLRAVLKGVNEYGREDIFLKEYSESVIGQCYVPFCAASILFQIPENIKGLHMFYSLYDDDRLLCENSLQMEIVGDKKTKSLFSKCNAACPEEWNGESYAGLYEEDDRNLLWIKGKGDVIYHVPIKTAWEQKKILPHMFQIEISTCECMEGTRITDEIKYSGKIRCRIGAQDTQVEIEDSPCDRRALFSNSAVIEDEEFEYKKSGRWGYGYRVLIPIPEEEMLVATKKAI